MMLTAFLTSQEVPEIRPAPVERDWMDRTPSGFAYRCLPLNIANAHGWEVLLPGRLKARWFGGAGLDTLTFDWDGPAHRAPVSHFGSGILTFHVPCLFRTEKGIDLWVGGSPNRLKHGIQPLTGIVETDWAPFTFTMNWRFTAPGEVSFEKGEPFCFFFPLSRAVAETCEPAFVPLDRDPETAESFRRWQRERSSFNADLKVEGSRAREQGWQRDYFRGLRPDGTESEDHRTRLRLRPFAPPTTGKP